MTRDLARSRDLHLTFCKPEVPPFCILVAMEMAAILDFFHGLDTFFNLGDCREHLVEHSPYLPHVKWLSSLNQKKL